MDSSLFGCVGCYLGLFLLDLPYANNPSTTKSHQVHKILSTGREVPFLIYCFIYTLSP
jgi:hypothetical protein